MEDLVLTSESLSKVSSRSKFSQRHSRVEFPLGHCMKFTQQKLQITLFLSDYRLVARMSEVSSTSVDTVANFYLVMYPDAKY